MIIQVLTKREAILKRQMDLFHFIKALPHGCKLSNEAILQKLAHIYNSTRTLQSDLNTLEQKFLINRKEKYINPSKSFRTISIVDNNKELMGQCNYNYLEALVLANPNCFKIKWRQGYRFHSGSIGEFLAVAPTFRRIGSDVYGTGVFLLKVPSVLLSSAPFKYESISDFNAPDYEHYLDDRALAF